MLPPQVYVFLSSFLRGTRLKSGSLDPAIFPRHGEPGCLSMLLIDHVETRAKGHSAQGLRSGRPRLNLQSVDRCLRRKESGI